MLQDLKQQKFTLDVEPSDLVSTPRSLSRCRISSASLRVAFSCGFHANDL